MELNEIQEKLRQSIRDAEKILKELDSYASLLKQKYDENFKKLKSDFGVFLNFDENAVKSFFKHPYKILPSKRPNEYFIVVPKFVDFNAGWLDANLTDEAWNVFIINKYLQWLGEIPPELKEELKLPEPKGMFVVDGELIFPEGLEEDVSKNFGKYLESIEKGKARIKPASEFFLLAELIERGELPFRIKPVDKNDLREPQVNFDFSGKWSFQKEAVEKFLQYSHIGLFYPMSAGKSFPAMYIMDMIKGRKALVVPNNTLRQQWIEYFKKYAPRLLNEVEIYTYLGGATFGKMLGKEYDIVVYDEAHCIPADHFCRLAMIKRKYSILLTGTPLREDKRENYIFSLSGIPVAYRWSELLSRLGKKFHKVNVYIVKNEAEKINKVKEIYNPEQKTIIYSFKLDLGEKVSKMLNLPFIYGETPAKERLDTILKSKSLVASSVVDLGVSVKDLEHIIEISGLFGSRREEMQLTARLFHSEEEIKTHSIIMTIDEFYSYKKRLIGLQERGFYINLIPCVKGFIFKEEEKETAAKKKKKGSKFW
jgi:DNA excision repair protein ERCC-3